MTTPSSWLLSCHHCQNMIDVPDATPGLIYICGICKRQLEVVDAERGVTRPPTAAPAAVAAEFNEDTRFPGQQPSFVPRSLQTPLPATQVAMPYDFPLQGFTIIEEVKQYVHGRRLRVQSELGRKHQALIINADLAADPVFASQVDAQAAAAARIQSPFIINIVKIERVQNTVIYLLNDYLKLETLTNFTRRYRVLNERVALNIIKKMAAILAEGQRQGLAHGWLRPDIVLLSERGDVILDELGIPKSPAFLLKKLRYNMSRVSHYLAPEYLDPQVQPDHRSDIFLMGCLLYRMLVGESLLKAASAEAALAKAVAEGVTPMSDVRDDLNPNLESFFTALTCVSRQERLSDYQEIIDRCDRLLVRTERFTSDQLVKVSARLKRPIGG